MPRFIKKRWTPYASVMAWILYFKFTNNDTFPITTATLMALFCGFFLHILIDRLI